MLDLLRRIRWSRRRLPHEVRCCAVAELIDVRVGVQVGDAAHHYVILPDDELAAIEKGTAVLVLIEALVVPAEPGLSNRQVGPVDYVLPQPLSWEDLEAAIDEALGYFAEDVSDQQFW